MLGSNFTSNINRNSRKLSQMKPEDITYVTTCKGRLHHLKKTLPKIVKQGLGGIIVVDFDCPDGSGQWVKENYPQVQVIKINAQPTFDYSRSRNIGGHAAKTKWIAFFDADVLVSENFSETSRRT